MCPARPSRSPALRAHRICLLRLPRLARLLPSPRRIGCVMYMVIFAELAGSERSATRRREVRENGQDGFRGGMVVRRLRLSRLGSVDSSRSNVRLAGTSPLGPSCRAHTLHRRRLLWCLDLQRLQTRGEQAAEGRNRSIRTWRARGTGTGTGAGNQDCQSSRRRSLSSRSSTTKERAPTASITSRGSVVSIFRRLN
jgi:hypothetical protein